MNTMPHPPFARSFAGGPPLSPGRRLHLHPYVPLESVRQGDPPLLRLKPHFVQLPAEHLLRPTNCGSWYLAARQWL